MAKRSRFREDTEVERLERENRELKAVIRSLTKQLKKTNRGYRKEREEKEIKEDKLTNEIKMCWDCGEGQMNRIILLGRSMRICSNCGKRTKAKIL